jgi:NADPH-dependent 7-cyano-7-deazaguanine reductase QueF
MMPTPTEKSPNNAVFTGMPDFGDLILQYSSDLWPQVFVHACEHLK